MNKVISRWFPAMTLLVWGGLLLHFHFSGRLAAFLHPLFRPLVPVAGAGLLLLAAGVLYFQGTVECCDEEACAHPLGRFAAGRMLTFLILLGPVCAATAFSPDRFGAGTILNRGVVSDASGLIAGKKPAPPAEPLPSKNSPVAESGTTAAAGPDDYLPRSKEGNLIVQVTDLLYAAQDLSLRGDFENRKIELIGQWMPDTLNNATGRRFKLVRMLMVCCAADARPVAVLVEESAKSVIPEMSWVRVTGRAVFPLEGGRRVAVVKADRVIVTDPPEETMLY